MPNSNSNSAPAPAPAPVPVPEAIALVDLDGTLCDYQGTMQRDLERLRSPIEPPLSSGDDDAPHLAARRKLIRQQKDWWLNLAPLPLGFEVVAMLKELDFRLHVLSKGPIDHHGAWAEKVEWCRRHLPNVSVTLTEDKGLVYGKVLVDDYPAYVERWLTWRPRGLVVMPAQPWNENFSHPNAIRYDGSQKPALLEALKRIRATAP
jgi:hypothetical protein